MKKIFPKIIDVICFVGGSSLFIGTLFDFHSNGSRESYGNYYYTKDQGYFIAFSIGLIVLGLLIRIWRKEKKI